MIMENKIIKVSDFMKKLNQLPFILQGRDDSHFYAHIENILRDLPDVGVQNWTPVEDGLPKRKGKYLASTYCRWRSKDSQYQTFELYYENDEWYYDYLSDRFEGKVLAWMEKPKPYKGD